MYLEYINLFTHNSTIYNIYFLSTKKKINKKNVKNHKEPLKSQNGHANSVSFLLISIVKIF